MENAREKTYIDHSVKTNHKFFNEDKNFNHDEIEWV